MAIESREETQKGPNDFPDKKSFFTYCREVAWFIYKLFTGKNIDDD